MSLYMFFLGVSGVNVVFIRCGPEILEIMKMTLNAEDSNKCEKEKKHL